MLSLIILALVPAYELRTGVTPVQKVIQLLQDMAAKGRQEKEDESVAFSAYKQFCDDTVDEKTRSIAEADAEIEQLQADIQKAESDAAVLSKKIAELDAEIASWEADKAALTEVRTKEHEDYRTTHVDYSESVDALERAVAILKRQAFDRKQGGALLQVTKLNRVPAAVKQTIFAFLNTDDEAQGIDVSAPQANAYEFQSGGVVDMLESLKDKFQDERNTLEKEEMNAKHAFEMAVQDLVDQIEQATQTRDRHVGTKAQLLQSAAEAKGNLADTTASRAEDAKYLEELNAQCHQKSIDFEARQQLRAEELEAIAKAIEILSSGDVSGAADTHLPALVQTSLATLRASAKSPLQVSAAAFLQDRADQLQSRILSMVALKVQNDPFEKVRKMIKDLIVRLMEEANEEAEHKGWCDTELATNKQTREKKTEEVDTLTSQVDMLTADIATLGEEIADLSKAIAEIDAAVAHATEVRMEEKAKNQATIKDAKAAQTAVAQALSVLKEFYAKAATATAFVQGPGDDAPATFDAPYQGMGAASGGIVGMIEVIQSDFARLEAETQASEETAQNEFDRFSAESAQDKAVKSTDLAHKERAKSGKEQDLQETSKDLKATQAELDAALAYYEKLKPSCVDSGLSYSDRVKRREEEIQSLQEALRILQGEDIA